MPRRLDLMILPGLFLLCALPVLLLLTQYMPTGEAPDEVAHMVRMESLLHGQWVGHRTTRLDQGGNTVADSGVLANASMLGAGFTFLPGTPVAQRGMTVDRVRELADKPWEAKPEFVSIPNTAVYPPLFYVPGALAMRAARWWDRGPWIAIQWARLTDATLYGAVGLAALLAARRLQGLFFATLLLPMSLWLAASCNQDGLIIATSVLSAALLTRGTPGAWWGALACFAGVAMAKPLYLPLIGAFVLLAPGRGPKVALRMAAVVAGAVPAVGWYLVAQHYAGAPFVRGAPVKAGPYWPGDPDQVFGTVDSAVQIDVVLHHPLLLLRLPVELFRGNWDWLLWQAIGLLGTLDVLLPATVYVVWLWALGALLLGETLGAPKTRAAPAGWTKLGVAASVAATAFAVCDGQYLSWTHIGAPAIEGVQGRYFLPLLAFAGLALPSIHVAGGAALRWLLRAPVVLAGVSGLAVIPGVVVWTYYLR